MAGMTASKPMNAVRGKCKVNGLRNPKERGNKPNEPT